MANYTYERSKYGGVTGSIIVHTVPGMQGQNDPTLAVFQDNVPGGYLRCDGSILNVKDYFALGNILGAGSETRFRKDNANIREPDATIGDFGQFQLPDLGSKVIIGGRNSGLYNSITVDRGVVEEFPTNRVGPQIEVISNFGNTITSNFVGNAQIEGDTGITMLGNPSMDMPGETSETTLNIENFQGHLHDMIGARYLNHTAQHRVALSGGKDSGRRLAMPLAGHVRDTTADHTATSVHKHNITRPVTYSHDFTYGYPETQVDMSGAFAQLTVKVENEEKLDELVTPFMLVEYLIKF